MVPGCPKMINEWKLSFHIYYQDQVNTRSASDVITRAKVNHSKALTRSYLDYIWQNILFTSTGGDWGLGWKNESLLRSLAEVIQREIFLVGSKFQPKLNKKVWAFLEKVNKGKVHLWHSRLAKIFRLARQCMAVMTLWLWTLEARSMIWL